MRCGLRGLSIDSVVSSPFFNLILYLPTLFRRSIHQRNTLRPVIQLKGYGGLDRILDTKDSLRWTSYLR